MKKRYKKELNALGARFGGRLTANLVVKEAGNKESPLHDYFDWNDSTAGHKHRLTQARQLIKSVKCEVRTETRTVISVGYVRDPSCDYHDQGYISIAKLKTDVERARDAIVNEFARAAAALERAHNVAAALEMTEAVEEVLEKVQYLHHRAVSFESEGIEH